MMRDLITLEEQAPALGRLSTDLHFVIRNLWAAIRDESDSIRADLNMPSGALGLLYVVAGNPGISQNDAATATVLHKTAVASLVKRLVEAGLLNREGSIEDGRVSQLTATKRGRAMMIRADGMLDALRDTAFHGVADAERESFFRICAQVAKNLDR